MLGVYLNTTLLPVHNFLRLSFSVFSSHRYSLSQYRSDRNQPPTPRYLPRRFPDSVYGTHTLTNFNTIVTIPCNDVRTNPHKRSVSQHGRYSPYPAACSFSRSRGSRVGRVSTRPAYRERRRQSLASCRSRRRAFDTIRRQSDVLARITRPPYGLPVRGRGTRDRRLSSPSARSATNRMRERVSRPMADWSPFVPTLERTVFDALSERRSYGVHDQIRGDTHRGRESAGAIIAMVPAVTDPEGSATSMARCGIPGNTRRTPLRRDPQP